MEISNNKLREFITDLNSLHQHAKDFNRKWVDQLENGEYFHLNSNQQAMLDSVWQQHSAWYEEVGVE